MTKGYDQWQLIALLQEIKSHRIRTGEPGAVRAFFGWQPVWLPPTFGCVIYAMGDARA